MWRGLVLIVGLATATPALASSGPFGGEGRGPIETIEDEIQEKKSEEEIAAQERLKAIEDAEGEQAARVVVLKWQDTDTDHTNETLMRNIKTRIARPNAKFYPEIDLYQAGRKEQDRSVRAIDQRAIVPDDAIGRILEAVDEVATIPWNALSEQDWGLKAHELRELAKELWFVDRVELREPLFLLYAQIGRAAENANNPSPPFYEQVGGRAVNYYWYLAGSMAHEEPALMSKLTEQDVNASINFYKDTLDSGGFPPMVMSFEMSGSFNPKVFAAEYQLFINGIEVLITDDKGLHRAAPGRVDVYMSRADGHSLSDRIELDKLDDKFYFVRDVARKRMGIDFIDQLMEHPNECTPEVDGDILIYLAIYAKLHQQAEIYIVVPKGGSIASRNLYLWRWDRPSGTLQKVLDDTGGFPVRFALLLGSGITFSGASIEAPTAESFVEDVTTGTPPTGTGDLPGASTATDQIPEPEFDPAAVPILYHLRAHYGRLLVTTGMELSANISANKPWRSRYQTDSEDGDDNILASETTVDGFTTTTGSGSQTVTPDSISSTEIVRERQWQRLVFLGFGVVLGRNAAIGFGPRGYIRTGWYNTPHAADLTGHLGYAALAPFSKHATGRVRPVVDADFWGGVLIPFRDSLLIKEDNKLGKPLPSLGATLSAGLTF